MKTPLPASSSLNFLAGIFAGAGINLLTSVATSQTGDVGSGEIALDSFFWVATAANLAWAAQLVERGERNADVAIRGSLGDGEKEEVREALERQSWRRARLPISLTVVSLIASVVFLPRFIHWGGLA
jgi:hypothetical protein